jgi:Tfp pilus assembly protein PilF
MPTKAGVSNPPTALLASSDSLSRIRPRQSKHFHGDVHGRVFRRHEIYVRAQTVLAGKEDEAIEEYQKAIEKDPKMGRAYAGLALVYRNRGRTKSEHVFREGHALSTR